MTRLTPVILAGPTASGKSALALRIAERDGGVVINADALQVYGCWRVLTARPGPEDLARAPHELYGHVPCDQRYSVGAWLRALAPILSDLARQGRRPVIVGGSGLYLGALTEGIADIPEIPAAIRAESEAMVRAGRVEPMLADLARDDPTTYARIDRANPMRVQRAWDVLRATGRGLAEWHKARSEPLLPAADCACVVINVETVILNNTIASRFHHMIEHGALEECQAFRASGLDRALPSARALGAAELMAYLDGAMSREDAIAAAVTATRQFAKRQRSWFRGRMADWPRVDPAAADPLAAVPGC